MSVNYELIPTPLGSTPWVPGYMTLSLSSIKKPQSSILSPDDFESPHSLLVSSVPANYISTLSKPGTYHNNNNTPLTSLSNSASFQKSPDSFESAKFNSNLVNNNAGNLLSNSLSVKGSRKSQSSKKQKTLHFLSDSSYSFGNSNSVGNFNSAANYNNVGNSNSVGKFNGVGNSYSFGDSNSINSFNTVGSSYSFSDSNSVVNSKGIVSSNAVIDPFNYKPIVFPPGYQPSNQPNQKPTSPVQNPSDKSSYLSNQNYYYAINKKPSHLLNQNPSYIPVQTPEKGWGLVNKIKVGVPPKNPSYIPIQSPSQHPQVKPSYLPPGVVSQSNLSPSVPQSYLPQSSSMSHLGTKSWPKHFLLLFLAPLAIPAQLLFVATGGLAFLITGILERLLKLSGDSIGKVWIGLNFFMFAPFTIGAAVLFPGFLLYLMELAIKLAV